MNQLELTIFTSYMHTQHIKYDRAHENERLKTAEAKESYTSEATKESI